MSASPLKGTWTLLAWYNLCPDGTRIYPLGEDASGYISYTQDGFVFVQLTAANRVLYANNDPFGGTEAEDSAAMKSQITYSGRYTDNGDHVVHSVTQASCPNWVGTAQIRNIEFNGDRLTLSASNAMFQGREVTAVVEWERAYP